MNVVLSIRNQLFILRNNMRCSEQKMDFLIRYIVHSALLPYQQCNFGRFPDMQNGDYNVLCTGF